MKFYLTVLSLLLKFTFVPWRIKLKHESTNENFVTVDFKGSGLPLVISFGGLGKSYNFQKTLSQYPVNVIYFRDLKHHWYLTGVPGAGKNVNEVVEFIKEKINKFSAPRVVTLGVSAGGFAALLYGSLLKVDHIIAFSPQTFMNRLNCIINLDYRWLDRVVEIYKYRDTDHRYLDLKNVVPAANMPVDIIYDKNHRLDRLHGRRIRGEKIHYLETDGGGHSAVKQLRDNGMLQAIIDNALLNNS